MALMTKWMSWAFCLYYLSTINHKMPKVAATFKTIVFRAFLYTRIVAVALMNLIEKFSPRREATFQVQCHSNIREKDQNNNSQYYYQKRTLWKAPAQCVVTLPLKKGRVYIQLQILLRGPVNVGPVCKFLRRNNLGKLRIVATLLFPVRLKFLYG